MVKSLTILYIHILEPVNRFQPNLAQRIFEWYVQIMKAHAYLRSYSITWNDNQYGKWSDSAKDSIVERRRLHIM